MPSSTHKSFPHLPDTGELARRAFELNLDYSFEVMAEVDSTQRYLLARNASQVPTGTVLVAHHQTAGQGRLTRTWQTRPGEGLMFSVALRPPHLASMPLVAGVAAATALRQWCGEVALKWPNDLVVETPDGLRKLGGIVASVHPEDPSLVILGIGINFVFDGEAPTDFAAALCEFVDELPTREVLLIAVLDQLKLLQLTDVTTVEDVYRGLCLTVGQRVRVHTLDGSLIEGEVADVSVAGVHVLDDTGVPRIFGSADVEHLRTS